MSGPTLRGIADVLQTVTGLLARTDEAADPQPNGGEDWIEVRIVSEIPRGGEERRWIEQEQPPAPGGEPEPAPELRERLIERGEISVRVVFYSMAANYAEALAQRAAVRVKLRAHRAAWEAIDVAPVRRLTVAPLPSSFDARAVSCSYLDYLFNVVRSEDATETTPYIASVGIEKG